MNIVIEKKDQNILIDGINTLLDLDPKSFNEVLDKLYRDKNSEIFFSYVTDSCDNPSAPIQLGLEKMLDGNGHYIAREYTNEDYFSISEIFKTLDDMSDTFKDNPEKTARAKALLETRDLKSFKDYMSSSFPKGMALTNNVFKILSDNKLCEEFLEYDKNYAKFSVNGEAVPFSDYLSYMNRLFSQDKKYGVLANNTEISENFYIPNLEEYKQRCATIFDSINVERILNPEYSFSYLYDKDNVVRNVIPLSEEPSWDINKELKDYVFSDMPKDLSLEEQAMFIYCKLCKELSYNDNYFYRKFDITNKPKPYFSKNVLENIKPGSKVSCWDFARVLSKFIDDLDGDIHSVMISEGIDAGHFSAGFYTDKVSAILEGINNGTGGTNDLMKAKTGMAFEGIDIISDKDNVLEKALNKVYPMVIGTKQLSIQDYAEKIKKLPKENNLPDDLEARLKAFIETMEESGISGNEAIQTFTAFYHSGYFGQDLDRAYMGKLYTPQKYRKEFKRSILIRAHKESSAKPGDTFYLLNSDPLELEKYGAKDLILALNTGRLVYESKNHTIPGVEKGDINRW